MNFNESLARSIAFSSGISFQRLLNMPDSRFKPYSRKVKKAYYKAKARFERTPVEHPDSRIILFQYELAYAKWSDLLRASDKRK